MIRWVGGCAVGTLGALLIGMLVLLFLLSIEPVRSVDHSPLATPRTTLIPPVTTTPSYP